MAERKRHHQQPASATDGSARGSRSNADASHRRAVRRQDLQDLYVQVMGAAYANTLVDAENAFARKDYAKTLRLVQSGRDRYAQSHRRVLRAKLPGEEGRGKKRRAGSRSWELEKKQEKCKRVLARFDEVISVLDKMVQMRAGEAESQIRGARGAQDAIDAPAISRAFRADYEKADSGAKKLDAVRRHFDLCAVASEEDILPRSLYFLRGKNESYLVETAEIDAATGSVNLRQALTGQSLKPLACQRLLAMGKQNRLVRLETRAAQATALGAETRSEHVKSPPAHAVRDPDAEILEMGAFSQLLDAAKRCGLVTNADLIAFTRDREFRRKEYQQAYQMIEGLFGKFTAASIRRQQQLRREDMDIASGKVKISPKKLMEKRARDIAETQRVDRCRNKFQRVLEGLRVLMRVGQGASGEAQ